MAKNWLSPNSIRSIGSSALFDGRPVLRQRALDQGQEATRSRPALSLVPGPGIHSPPRVSGILQHHGHDTIRLHRRRERRDILPATFHDAPEEVVELRRIFLAPQIIPYIAMKVGRM